MNIWSGSFRSARMAPLSSITRVPTGTVMVMSEVDVKASKLVNGREGE